jgi:hypothetical protein
MSHSTAPCSEHYTGVAATMHHWNSWVCCALKIVHLDMSGSIGFTDAGIMSLVSKLKLRSLGLRYDEGITNTSIQYVMQYCAKTLEVFRVYHVVGHSPETQQHLITTAGLNELYTRCVHLQRFTWSTTVVQSNNGVNFISCNKCNNIIIYDSISNAVLLLIAQHCKELVHLDLYFMEHTCTSSGLRALIQGCPKLKSIYVNEYVDKAPFIDVVSEYPHLITSNFPDVRFDVMKLPI